jgi:hypothetical protein
MIEAIREPAHQGLPQHFAVSRPAPYPPSGMETRAARQLGRGSQLALVCIFERVIVEAVS